MIHKQFTKKWKKSPSGFELTNEDLHNLYDLFNLIQGDFYELLKINKIEKWYIDDFYYRVEKKAVPELWEDKK